MARKLFDTFTPGKIQTFGVKHEMRTKQNKKKVRFKRVHLTGAHADR